MADEESPRRGPHRIERKDRCAKCRRWKAGVRFDPGTRKHLCPDCWFHTVPSYPGSAPND